MTGLPFWTGQIIYDVLVSLILLQFGALGVVAARIPHFFARLLSAVFYGRERVFLVRLPRYIGRRLFVLIGRIQSMLLLSISCYLVLDDEGQLMTLGLWESLFFLALLFLFFCFFFWLWRLFYMLWGYLFSDNDTRRLWRGSYTLLEWLWGIALFPVAVIYLYAPQLSWFIYLLPVIFVLWRLIIIVKTLRPLPVKKIGFFHVSLYLCAHEILPLVYMMALLEWSVNNKEIMAIWQ